LPADRQPIEGGHEIERQFRAGYRHRSPHRRLPGASAEPYPIQRLTLIVPFPAGAQPTA